jgi:hypothetical protein
MSRSLSLTSMTLLPQRPLKACLKSYKKEV